MTRITPSIAIAALAVLASCQGHGDNRLDGKVKRETISLAPKYAGRIVKITVQEGDWVNPGDTLAVLDIPEVEAKKQQAEGAVQEATVVMAERFVIAPKRMSIETVALHEGELALPGYNLIIGYDPTTTWFRFTVGESDIARFKKGDTYTVSTTFGDRTVQAKLAAVNELARYGARTSSYPNHQPGETVYELKMVPLTASDAQDLLTNLSVQLKK